LGTLGLADKLFCRLRGRAQSTANAIFHPAFDFLVAQICFVRRSHDFLGPIFVMPNLDVKSYTPPRRVRALIGDIIMVGAEIDHLVTLALFNTTNIDFTIGFALFDRASIGSKLSKLRYFMGFQKDELVKSNFKVLDKHLEPFLKLRNALAHGVLIGKRLDEIIFMLTAEYQDYEGSFSSGAVGYREEQFKHVLNRGRECVKMLKELFDVKPLHETTEYKLRPGKSNGPKSRRKSSPLKDRRQPRSSRA
jgi:hypothetical protein